MSKKASINMKKSIFYVNQLYYVPASWVREYMIQLVASLALEITRGFRTSVPSDMLNKGFLFLLGPCDSRILRKLSELVRGLNGVAAMKSHIFVFRSTKSGLFS